MQDSLGWGGGSVFSTLHALYYPWVAPIHSGVCACTPNTRTSNFAHEFPIYTHNSLPGFSSHLEHNLYDTDLTFVFPSWFPFLNLPILKSALPPIQVPAPETWVSWLPPHPCSAFISDHSPSPGIQRPSLSRQLIVPLLCLCLGQGCRPLLTSPMGLLQQAPRGHHLQSHPSRQPVITFPPLSSSRPSSSPRSKTKLCMTHWILSLVTSLRLPFPFS